MRSRANDRDCLRGERPKKKFRTVGGTIQRNDDLKFFLRIIQRETVLEFFLQSTPLIVSRDDYADRGLPVRFVYGSARQAPRQSEQRRIPEIDVANKT